MVKQNCDPRHRPCFGGIGVGSQPSLDNTAFRATMTRTPEFEPIDVAWGQTVILQELITHLIQSAWAAGLACACFAFSRSEGPFDGQLWPPRQHRCPEVDQTQHFRIRR